MNSAMLDHTILPEEELRKLICAHRNGDTEAAASILAHNERAIFRIARRYQSTGRCGDVPLEDLMQLGRMGMLRALEDFDLQSGHKFLTYAWWWSRMFISRYGELEGQQINLSYRARGKRGKIALARAKFVHEQKREPTVYEIAELVGIDVRQVMLLRTNVTSLDFYIESKKQTVGELTPSVDGDIAERVEKNIMAETVKANLVNLPSRSRSIITRFYGLDGKPAESLHAIARRLGISHERVRQIKEAALIKLRESL